MRTLAGALHSTPTVRLRTAPIGSSAMALQFETTVAIAGHSWLEIGLPSSGLTGLGRIGGRDMSDRTIRDRYFTLLRAYVLKPDNAQLQSAADLGRELFAAGIQFEDVAELHGEALSRLALAHPDLRLGEIAPFILRPFAELVTAYDCELSGRLEANRRSEAALRESEERFALAARGASDGLWDWNLRTGQIYFSSRWKQMLGDVENQTCNKLDDWFDRVHPDDQERLRSALSAHLAGILPHFEQEYRLQHSDGQYRWFLVRGLAVRDETGTPMRIAGSQTDVTDRKRHEADLRHDATHDPLTRLPNRTHFTNRLSRAIARAQNESSTRFAVLFLDLDGFKLINDSLGHSAGDQLLIAVARRLQECVRAGDMVARLGGDEFTIFLDNVSDTRAVYLLAERIHERLRLAFVLGDHELMITTSIGIALSETGYTSPDDVLRDADIAMYRAKQSGKGRHLAFDREMHAQALARLQMENDLRRAIERREFRIEYQPIVCLETGRIVSFEALLRWEHPQRGRISPAEFIPLTEETGLIVPIGQWMLRAAFADSIAWQQKTDPNRPVPVAVNISWKQFTPDLMEEIESLLGDPRCHGVRRPLHLEITESVFMEDADSTIAMLHRLREMDVQLSIDDFGTGYSSLSYLRRSPFEILKIDRSFIQAMDDSVENTEIVQTIIILAHSLGLDVVAEGVETVDQYQSLRAAGCDYGQGFLFSRPLRAEHALAIISAEPPWSRNGRCNVADSPQLVS